ncbi:hypothetical protein [Albirhodobacter sp. R86504]|uniref:hypothetical protein n=1 Tax=Albirhodobacter sp. R86504 TaxID=3093848 RepID=UPI00366E0B63
MANFNDMRPCDRCGQVRNVEAMDRKSGLWLCAQCARDPAALARMIEDHTPPEPKRWPSGWWLLPALFVSTAFWWWLFGLLGWL